MQRTSTRVPRARTSVPGARRVCLAMDERMVSRTKGERQIPPVWMDYSFTTKSLSLFLPLPPSASQAAAPVDTLVVPCGIPSENGVPGSHLAVPLSTHQESARDPEVSHGGSSSVVCGRIPRARTPSRPQDTELRDSCECTCAHRSSISEWIWTQNTQPCGLVETSRRLGLAALQCALRWTRCVQKGDRAGAPLLSS